LLQVKE